MTPPTKKTAQTQEGCQLLSHSPSLVITAIIVVIFIAAIQDRVLRV